MHPKFTLLIGIVFIFAGGLIMDLVPQLKNTGGAVAAVGTCCSLFSLFVWLIMAESKLDSDSK